MSRLRSYSDKVRAKARRVTPGTHKIRAARVNVSLLPLMGGLDGPLLFY